MNEVVFSVEAISSARHGETALNGWAVVRREGALPREVIAMYLTSEQAEAAAERLRNAHRSTAAKARAARPVDPAP